MSYLYLNDVLDKEKYTTMKLDIDIGTYRAMMRATFKYIFLFSVLAS